MRFRFVEVFTNRVEERPLEAQRSLPFEVESVNGGVKAVTKIDRRVRIPFGDGAIIELDATRIEAAVRSAGGTIAWNGAVAPPVRAAKPATEIKLPGKPIPGVPQVERRVPRGEAFKSLDKGGPASTKRGSGARIRELLTKGWSVDKILETIHQEFPGSKAKEVDVRWNKRKLEQGVAP